MSSCRRSTHFWRVAERRPEHDPADAFGAAGCGQRAGIRVVRRADARSSHRKRRAAPSGLRAPSTSTSCAGLLGRASTTRSTSALAGLRSGRSSTPTTAISPSSDSCTRCTSASYDRAVDRVLARRMEVELDEPVLVAPDRQRVVAVLGIGTSMTCPVFSTTSGVCRVVELESRKLGSHGVGDVDGRLLGARQRTARTTRRSRPTPPDRALRRRRVVVPRTAPRRPSRRAADERDGARERDERLITGPENAYEMAM